LFIGIVAMKPENRAGCTAHNAAIPSVPRHDNSSALAGSATFSNIGGAERQDLVIPRPEHIHHREPAQKVGHHRHITRPLGDVAHRARMRSQGGKECRRPDLVENVDLAHVVFLFCRRFNILRINLMA